MKKNVLEWLEEAVLKHPDRIIYEDPEESVTYSDVLEEAKRIGYSLLGMGLSGKPVAVMMKRSVHTIAAFLGVVYSGRAYAPVDPAQPAQRIKKELETLSPDLIIKDADLVPEDTGIKTVDAPDLTKGEPDEKALLKVRDSMTEDSPLYIIFTSGSGGRPKAVITSHHSLMCYISAYTGVMKVSQDDRLCSQSPLDYIAAIRDIYVPMLTGAYTYLCPKEFFMQPSKLFDIMNEKKITCVGWSTSALCVLSKLGAFREARPEHLKKVCFSGSVMPGAVLGEWQEQFPGVLFVNQYGPTEATASCTYHIVDHAVGSDETLPIGRPYDGYKVFLLSEDDSEVPAGEPGEICVGGPCVALGYYNDAEKTGKAFVQNPLNSSFREIIYRTGDIGVFREDGILEFHGRRDRQIKHMGHRVELDEIESSAMECDGVSSAAALYDKEKEALWLFYSGGAGIKELMKQLKERIPGFMVPRKIKQLDALPVLANGKTDLRTLGEMTKEA